VNPDDTIERELLSTGADGVIITEQLRTRPSRPRNDRAVNAALVKLAQALAKSPETVLNELACAGLELCKAHSAGISLLTEIAGKSMFQWHAVAGVYTPLVWGTLPRDFSPCGTVLDTDSIQLMRHPERHFTYLAAVEPHCSEVLLVPFHVNGKAVGTIWIISHDESRKFDAQDAEVMSTLGEFAAAAYTATSNVAELQKSRELLHEANTELAGSVADLELFALAGSHDLQEPLRTVSVYMELLHHRLRDHGFDQQGEDLIQAAISGAGRMKRLLDDVLSFSRLARDERALTSVNLNEIVLETVANLSSLIRDNGAVVSYDSLPDIVADRSRLILLFQNLVTNAIKYRRPETPRVKVIAERKDRFWVIAVADNGEGFDEEYANAIFEPFTRLHGADRPGTGMGLAMCQKIVRQHGGSMWAVSKAGFGSTFYFTMPA
jgi:signal transduction histidine kinase